MSYSTVVPLLVSFWAKRRILPFRRERQRRDSSLRSEGQAEGQAKGSEWQAKNYAGVRSIFEARCL